MNNEIFGNLNMDGCWCALPPSLDLSAPSSHAFSLTASE